MTDKIERGYLSDPENFDLVDEYMDVDFRKDFNTGPGRTEVIKAIAKKWSKYESRL